jgi:hypothetical protein
MSGTGPRQRAAIALSFGVQAFLIAGALTLPAALSSAGGVSSSSSVAVPGPVTLLPVMSPLPRGSAFPVTVTIGGTGVTGIYPAGGGPAPLLAESGTDLTATVTLTLPGARSLSSVSFTLADQRPAPASAASAPKALRVVSGPVGPGTHTFTLPLDSLPPRGGWDIVMTATDSGGQGGSSGVIAEIVTS